jgi:AcrR family transcriptional regulator
MASEDHQPPAPAHLHLGRGGLSREEVNDIQRARILSAMVEVASELGYAGAAVAPVVARAGVSRRTFYELFEDREDCFLAAFEWGAQQAREALAETYRLERPWRVCVRHTLAALLGFLDAEPRLARVLAVEALSARGAVLERRRAIMSDLIAALDRDAPRRRGAREVPGLTAEAVIGGAFSVIHARLLERPPDLEGGPGAAGRDRPPAGDKGPDRLSGGADRPSREAGEDGGSRLIDLHGQLMALIVLPYLGPRAAAQEAARAAPEVPPRAAARPGVDGGRRLLERLDMRLTYRTVRCLMFIGEHPGASNREVAIGAEVPDEGQASKLLGRLAGLGLIANGRPSGPGQANRWTLTPHGEQVLSTVHRRG